MVGYKRMVPVAVCIWLTWVCLPTVLGKEFRTASVCYDSTGIVKCLDHEVMMVDRAHYDGIDRAGNKCPQNTGGSVCSNEVTEKVRKMCSGYSSCVLHIPSNEFRDYCGVKGYISAVYGCAPENEIITTAGEHVLDKDVNYIQSPGYPHGYRHNNDITYIVRNNEEEKMRISAYDFRLEAADRGGTCQDFVKIVNKDNGEETTLCGTHEHFMRDLKAKQVDIIFHTDSEWNERGFFIKVQIGVRAGAIPPFGVTRTPSTGDETAGARIPGSIIAVIIVVIVLFLFFLAVCIICLCKRKQQRRRKKERPEKKTPSVYTVEDDTLTKKPLPDDDEYKPEKGGHPNETYTDSQEALDMLRDLPQTEEEPTQMRQKGPAKPQRTDSGAYERYSLPGEEDVPGVPPGKDGRQPRDRGGHRKPGYRPGDEYKPRPDEYPEQMHPLDWPLISPDEEERPPPYNISPSAPPGTLKHPEVQKPDADVAYPPYDGRPGERGIPSDGKTGSLPYTKPAPWVDLSPTSLPYQHPSDPRPYPLEQYPEPLHPYHQSPHNIAPISMSPPDSIPEVKVTPPTYTEPLDDAPHRKRYPDSPDPFHKTPSPDPFKRTPKSSPGSSIGPVDPELRFKPRPQYRSPNYPGYFDNPTYPGIDDEESPRPHHLHRSPGFTYSDPHLADLEPHGSIFKCGSKCFSFPDHLHDTGRDKPQTDEDRALDAAIRAATGVDPDKTVKKMELKQDPHSSFTYGGSGHGTAV